MKIHSNGWLDEGEHYLSPYQNHRPSGEKISLLVIHNISLPPHQYGDCYISDLFLGLLPQKRKEYPYLDSIADLKVAAHFLILRDGCIKQYVATTERAWHAGISCYAGRENCNDYSIGIELNGSDHYPYTQRQYKALVALTHSLIQRHPDITLERIVGHSDIAPVRKTDPGSAFNWHYYRALLHKVMNKNKF